MTKPRILVTFGTRPEAIKMAPVIHALKSRDTFETLVCVTAQHRELLDQVLNFFGIMPDFDLDLMEPNQPLDTLGARVLLEFGKVLEATKPDRVLVHGDTLTSMMASLACYLRHVPVGHVEAGLRSGDLYSPWPEEGNRKITDTLADLHFAPTAAAAKVLRAESNSGGSVHVTGNTVIDALLDARSLLAARPALAPSISALRAELHGRKVIAVTAHRRENFGQGMENIAAALLEIAAQREVAIIYPLHPNPNVASIMREALGEASNILLLPPLDYPDFVDLLNLADLILTDSGGVQEEAPSLGKPVLVLREVTERPEGIAAGTAILVGTDCKRIVSTALRLLDDPSAYTAMARAHNPYGDGQAAKYIVDILEGIHLASTETPRVVTGVFSPLSRREAHKPRLKLPDQGRGTSLA